MGSMGEQNIGKALLELLGSNLYIELCIWAVVVQDGDQLLYLFRVRVLFGVECAQQLFEDAILEVPHELPPLFSKSTEQTLATYFSPKAFSLAGRELDWREGRFHCYFVLNISGLCYIADIVQICELCYTQSPNQYHKIKNKKKRKATLTLTHGSQITNGYRHAQLNGVAFAKQGVWHKNCRAHSSHPTHWLQLPYSTKQPGSHTWQLLAAAAPPSQSTQLLQPEDTQVSPSGQLPGVHTKHAVQLHYRHPCVQLVHLPPSSRQPGMHLLQLLVSKHQRQFDQHCLGLHIFVLGSRQQPSLHSSQLVLSVHISQLGWHSSWEHTDPLALLMTQVPPKHLMQVVELVHYRQDAIWVQQNTHRWFAGWGIASWEQLVSLQVMFMQDSQQLYCDEQRQRGAQGRHRKYSKQKPSMHSVQDPAALTLRQLSVGIGQG